MSETSFDYSNLSGRPVTPLVRGLGVVLPGVRQVQRRVEPYAESWGEANRRALARSEGLLWVALGDSMTQGIGATAYHRGWVGQLADRFPVAPRVVNLSFNGARVADVLDRQLPAMEGLGVQPDLVTVLIGNNDLVSKRWRPLLDASTADLLSRLPAGSVVANQPGAGPAVRRLNRVIDRGVAEHGLVLADCRDPRMRSWRGKLSADYFHPNDRGYAAIADVVGDVVLPLMGV